MTSRSTGDSPLKQSIRPPIPAIVRQVASKNCQGAVAQQLLQYNNFTDLLPDTTRLGHPALIGTDDRSPLSHDSLAKFIRSFPGMISKLGLDVTAGTRFGIVLPNGPEVSFYIDISTHFHAIFIVKRQFIESTRVLHNCRLALLF